MELRTYAKRLAGESGKRGRPEPRSARVPVAVAKALGNKRREEQDSKSHQGRGGGKEGWKGRKMGFEHLNRTAFLWRGCGEGDAKL